MKRKPKPALIGAFVVGAVLIAVIGVGVLASGAFFKETAPFLSYFEESVDGLDVGAPVKFSGIKIGEVKEIGLFATTEPPNRYASVVYEVDLGYIRSLGIESDFTNRAVVREQIDLGMRVRLELASIVTGVVFMELEFDEDAEPPTFVSDNPPYPEIPTSRSALAELGQSATEVIARLSAVDAPVISEKLIAVLETIDSTLAGADLREVTESLSTAIRELRQAIAEADVARSAEKFQTTLDEFQEVGRSLNEHIEPTLVRVDSATRKLDRTLSVLESAATDVNRVISPESDVVASIEQAMEANRRAMESLRILSETLERNPRVLLTGKPKTRN